MDVQIALVAHAAATWFLAGLIWVVQRVHYPLFDHVDAGRFVAFEQAHARRITWIVAPAMGLELITGAWLPWAVGPGIERSVLLVGAGLIAFLWISTAFIQVPCHARLAHGYDAAAHRRLVRTNSLRTAAWSLRALLVSWLLLRMMGPQAVA